MESPGSSSRTTSRRRWWRWYQLFSIDCHCRYVPQTLLCTKLISYPQDMVPIREVAKWRSYVNIAATTGRSLGGPIGGFLTDTVGWRW